MIHWVKQHLERLLGESFANRYKDIRHQGHWGRFDDGLCLATIYGIKFKIINVELQEHFRVLHTADVHGIRRDGHRLSKATEVQQCLIFFTNTRVGAPHYGVGVPVL